MSRNPLPHLKTKSVSLRRKSEDLENLNSNIMSSNNKKTKTNLSISKEKESDDEFNFNVHWSLDNNDYNEDDSIFLKLNDNELNEGKINFEENDSNDGARNQCNNDDDGIQCTQKFINDIIEKVNFSNWNNNFNLLDLSLNSSQYHSRDDVIKINEQNNCSINISKNSKTSVNDNESMLSLNSSLSVFSTSWCNSDQHEISLINTERYDFPTKGPFYGLPADVEKLLYKYKKINSLYEWQKECLTLPAIKKRKNLLYALPTSGGKTLVAEILMLREIICRKKNVIFILPYVSIVQEKVASMSPFALNFDFLVEEYTSGKGKCPPTKLRKRKCLYIASIEKGAILLDSLIEAQRANEIGLIVIDELHLMGEQGRGATLEALLTKVMYLQAGIQIVGMSATIGNLPELSDFLNADVYTRGFRPIELKEYIKCGNDILEVNSQGETINDMFVYKRTIDFKYSNIAKKVDPDHIAGLVSEVTPKESCLVFCSTRKNCENVAILLTKVLPKKRYIEYKKENKIQLMRAIEELCGSLSSILKQTIPFGIGYHHSGLTTEERKIIESAYRDGILSIICCTSTLAAGVNLPAKRVIIRAPYVGSKFITLCQYKQMIGRAGRAGIMNTDSCGESILICSSRDNYEVGQMLFSPMDKIKSSMNNQNSIGLESLLLSSIGLNLADCLRDLLKLASQTLLSVQSNELNISIRETVTKTIRLMFKHKILKVNSTENKTFVELETKDNNNGSIITTQEIREKNEDGKQSNSLNNTSSVDKSNLSNKTKLLVLSKSTKFELTTIGKAAFKAGIDYKKTQSIYHELKIALKSLVLSNYGHLLYLVVCFNSPDNKIVDERDNNISENSNNKNNANGNNDIVYTDPSILFREYNNMNEELRIVAKTIGITDAHAIKMAKTLSIKGPMELILNRFYKVMILNDVVNLVSLNDISIKYNIERGNIQNLITQSLSAASSLIRLCEQVDEFWCYKTLFERISYKLDHCCIPELAPLLDLPSVKIGRAKQLHNAGFKTIEDIAKTTSKILVQSVEHMPYRTAKEIISAAKIMLVKKLEFLQEETESIMNCLMKS